MNRALSRLVFGSLLIAMSSCGIEGSGVTSPVSITSAGAVTGLGSIFVNAVEYDLAGATITIDGRSALESDLDVGSVVIVEGTLNPDGVSGRATRVTADHAVAGPIDSVAITGDGFTVLGQTIHVDAVTVIENAIDGRTLGGLTLGSDVMVSGFADSSGTITARHIAQRPVGKSLLVTGYVTALDTLNRRFTINDLIVDYANASLVGFNSDVTDGAAVRVIAAVVGENSAIAADEVALRSLRMPGAVGDEAALQGWVTRFASPSDFDVDGRRVTATMAAPALTLDSFVTVDGTIAADGVVDFEELLSGGVAKVRVTDVNGTPIVGATVTIVDGAARYEAITDANGIARFPTLTRHTGEGTVFIISAEGFETEALPTGFGPGDYIGLSLEAEGDWAIGRPIVLGTHVVDRASDGSSMTFSIDISVIDEQSKPIETLTGADFSIGLFDCGWGDGRDCASDAEGNHTGNWGSGGHPTSFLGLQAPPARRPYLVDVLAVRSDRYDGRTNRPYWGSLAPALRSLAAEVAAPDSLSLTSVQFEDGSVTDTVLGPFTSDASIYFDAIDGLGQPAGHDWPPALDSLIAAIRRVSQARDESNPAAAASVFVLGQPSLTVAETKAVSTLAQELDVRVSTVEYWTTYGAPEISARTGGFVAWVRDSRQFPMVFGAMDEALADDIAFYRMEFELTGGPGTFVAGGNAKVQLGINVPTPLITSGLYATADVAIP